MRARQESVEQTRLRITEATMRLHERVGPAATTVSAIADEAGVTRLTVYRHFPDDAALVIACSGHWRALHPRPDLRPAGHRSATPCYDYGPPCRRPIPGPDSGADDDEDLPRSRHDAGVRRRVPRPGRAVSGGDPRDRVPSAGPSRSTAPGRPSARPAHPEPGSRSALTAHLTTTRRSSSWSPPSWRPWRLWRLSTCAAALGG